MLVSIDERGTARAIYSDEGAPILATLGRAHTSRASHVEPQHRTASDPDGTEDTTAWVADLSPVGGPTLGPFATRAEALADEVTWIENHILGDTDR